MRVSAETLRVLPPTHSSYRQEILDASRRKYSISKGDAQKLIEEEEATIIRSAEEKAIIEGKGKGSQKTAEKESKEENKKESLEKESKVSQEAEPMI